MSHPQRPPVNAPIGVSGVLLPYELLSVIFWPSYYALNSNRVTFHPYAPNFFGAAINPIATLTNLPNQHTQEAIRNIFYQSNGLPLELELGSVVANESGMHQNLIDTYWTSPLKMYYQDSDGSGMIHRPFAKPTSVLYNVPISSGHPDAILEHPELRLAVRSEREVFLASGHMLPLGYEGDYITQIQANLRFMFDNPHKVPIHPTWQRETMSSALLGRQGIFGSTRGGFYLMGDASIESWRFGLPYPSNLTVPMMTLEDNIFLNNIQGRYTDFISMGDGIDYVSPGSGFPVSSGFGPVIPDAIHQITHPLEYAYNMYGIQNVKFTKNGLYNTSPLNVSFPNPVFVDLPGQLKLASDVLRPIGSTGSISTALAYPKSSFAFFPEGLNAPARKPNQTGLGTDFWTLAPDDWVQRSIVSNRDFTIASGDYRYPPNLIEYNSWVSEFDTIRARFAIMTTQPTNLKIQMDFTNIPSIPVQGDVVADRFGKSYPNRLQYEWKPFISYQLNNLDRRGREFISSFTRGWTNTNQQHDYDKTTFHEFNPTPINGVFNLSIPSAQMPMDNNLAFYNYNNLVDSGGEAIDGLFNNWRLDNIIGKVFYMTIGWELTYVGGSVAGGSMVNLRTEDTAIDLPIPTIGSLKVNGRELTIDETLPDSRNDAVIRLIRTTATPPGDIVSTFAESLENNIITVTQQPTLKPPRYMDGSDDSDINDAENNTKLDYRVILSSAVVVVDFTVTTFFETLSFSNTCGASVSPHCQIELFNGLHEILFSTRIFAQSFKDGTDGQDFTTSDSRIFNGLPNTAISRSDANIGQAANLPTYYYAWQDLYLIVRPIPNSDYSGTGALFGGGSSEGPNDTIPCNGLLLRQQMEALLPNDAESYPITIDKINIRFSVVDDLERLGRFSNNRLKTIEITASPGFTAPGSSEAWSGDSGPLRVFNVPPVFESYWDANSGSPFRIR